MKYSVKTLQHPSQSWWNCTVFVADISHWLIWKVKASPWMYYHTSSVMHTCQLPITTTTVLRPFVWDYPGEPVPEETLTHPPSWSSSNLYQLTWNSIFYLNITHPPDHSYLCLLKCHLIFFPDKPGLTSVSTRKYFPTCIHCSEGHRMFAENQQYKYWHFAVAPTDGAESSV